MLFNDYFMKIIYSNVLKTITPKILVTLGDILSSEWIDENEFLSRVQRFIKILSNSKNPLQFQETHFQNISGNHDIGYGYKTDKNLISRWEKNFGSLNYDFYVDNNGDKVSSADIQYGTDYHHFIFINANNLDSTEYRDSRDLTWNFLNNIVNIHKRYRDTNSIPSILFTHIPLHKPDGYCADGPNTAHTYNGYIIYQNLLSPIVSQYLLRCIKPTLIFTGHDHVGCNYLHQTNMDINIDSEVYQRLLLSYNVSDIDSNNKIKAPILNILDNVNTKTELVLKLFCNSLVEQIDKYSFDWLELFNESHLNPNSKLNSQIKYNSNFCDNAKSKCFITQEVTVRSIMGDYSGAFGVFSFSELKNIKSSSHLLKIKPNSILDYKAFKMKTGLPEIFQLPGLYSSISFKSGNYFYKYQELRFVHHIMARIIFFVSIFLLAGTCLLSLPKRSKKNIKISNLK
ncbi:hypothetical protein BB561_005523 [Smittium simulii]|uniref:Calcineurin-like phosphoesterase domain-containing protein n=1 Tax=Smittium simulii TaxID=133385 RepID=A0A2T9Y9Z7_9FUNG|nr:hypothetical protein BB561_005523 [Smittium simulii]